MRPKHLPNDPLFPRHYFLILALIILGLVKILADWFHQHLNLFALLDHLLLIMLVALVVHLLDRYLLWKDVITRNRETLEKLTHEQNSLLNSVVEAGIASTYRSRFAARKDISRSIKDANKRVWLLGVGLNVIIDLEQMIHDLENKKNAGVDVRVLMLDAFRSTAVFRTFLESDPSVASKMLKHYEDNTSNPVEKELYFTQRLCSKFEYICRRLRGSEALLGSIRFYAHTPTCWMLLTENDVYFQPYTFGSLPPATRVEFLGDTRDPKEQFTKPDTETIGDLMPVFRFHDVNEGSAYRILVDHFRKLWSTSDEDLFHNLPRQQYKEALLRKIFSERLTWLKHVNGAIHSARKPYEHEPNDTTTDRYRKFVRKICPTIISVSIISKEQGTPLSKHGRIYDFSRYGLGLELDFVNGSFKEGDKVIVTNQQKDAQRTSHENETLLSSFFAKEMLGEGHPYEIKHIAKKRIGLQMVGPL